MSALRVLNELFSRGIRITPKGSVVSLSPADKLTPDLLQRVKTEKPDLIRLLERARIDAGDDWDEIAADYRQMRAVIELRMIEDMRHRGIVPSHYTATTVCAKCGEVPIFEGAPTAVQGCPWCFNRRGGLPMP